MSHTDELGAFVTTEKVAAVEKVYLAVRAGIVDGSFPPGSRLGEADLAESLDVSRTPVREALRRLSSDGLIETLPNRGARVRSWSVEEIIEIFEVRALLEGRAASLAARRSTPEFVDELAELCSAMEAAATARPEPDLSRVATLNRQFHRLIMERADSPLLVGLVESVTLFALTVRTFEGYGERRLEQSMRQHRELVDAVAASDPMWAESVMRAHILSATHVLTEVVARDAARAIR
jgi:DNA-binding GntR family transcriptional regulator